MALKWTGRESPAEISAETKKTVELRLQQDAEALALSRLIEAGCSRDVIAATLYRLRRTSQTDPISKLKLDIAIDRLNEAINQIERLQNSQIARLIFEKLKRSEQLIAELQWVVERAEATRSNTSARKAPRRDDLRWELDTYVKKKTGKYHDDEVSTLIAAVEDNDGGADDNVSYNAGTHRKGRSRYKKLRGIVGL